MTTTEFNTLSINHRCDLLWEWANYITSIRNAEINTIIFSMDDFFIRVQVSLDNNQTLKIEALYLHELEKEGLKIMITDPLKVRLLSETEEMILAA